MAAGSNRQNSNWKSSLIPSATFAGLVFADDAGDAGDEQGGENPAETNLAPTEASKESGRQNQAKPPGRPFCGTVLRVIGVGLPAVGLAELDERKGVFEGVNGGMKGLVVWWKLATFLEASIGVFVGRGHASGEIAPPEKKEAH